MLDVGDQIEELLGRKRQDAAFGVCGHGHEAIRRSFSHSQKSIFQKMT